MLEIADELTGFLTRLGENFSHVAEDFEPDLTAVQKARENQILGIR